MKRKYIVRNTTGFGQRMGQAWDFEALPDDEIRNMLFHCARVYEGHGLFKYLMSKTTMLDNSDDVFYVPLGAAYLEINFPDDLMASMWEFFELCEYPHLQFTPLNDRQDKIISIIKSRNNFIVEPGVEVAILLELEGEKQ